MNAQPSEKIESLRELLSLVIENTKRESQGKKSNLQREQRALNKHVETLLGRQPEPHEISRLQL